MVGGTVVGGGTVVVVTGGTVVVVLVTVTMIEASAVLPAASYARADRVFAPPDAADVSQEKPNGADLSVAARVPSTRSSTLATPTLSEALTEMGTLPETVAPPLGAANATSG